MTEKIAPALTPEEWAEALFVGTNPPPGGQIRFTVRGPETWHRMAAVALHGKPFGFTREKLSALLALVDRLDGHAELSDEDRALVDWHTDRIEALLPPVLPEGK